MLYKTVAGIMCLWSRIYTYNISQRLFRLGDVFYTLWIKNFIGKVGEGTVFSKPLFLQGGGGQRIKIGTNTHFAHHCILGCWKEYDSGDIIRYYEPEIIIGNNCSIGEYCHITAVNKITIEDGLLTGRFVYIGDNSHGGLSQVELDIPPIQRELFSKGRIRIGRNVWIGDKVSILGGVTIGDNVIIGAGSIVTHDIPSNSLAAGVPAIVLKQI